MQDQHVDRPGVEEPRGLKLTGTNRSIGLNSGRSMHGGDIVSRPCGSLLNVNGTVAASPASDTHAARRAGGYAGGSPPDPIPNSAVKSPRVDGTTSQGVGE